MAGSVSLSVCLYQRMRREKREKRDDGRVEKFPTVSWEQESVRRLLFIEALLILLSWSKTRTHTPRLFGPFLLLRTLSWLQKQEVLHTINDLDYSVQHTVSRHKPHTHNYILCVSVCVLWGWNVDGRCCVSPQMMVLFQNLPVIVETHKRRAGPACGSHTPSLQETHHWAAAWKLSRI